MNPLHTISLSQAASDAVQTYSLTKKESNPVTTVALTPAATPRAAQSAAGKAKKAPAASHRKGRK